MALPSFPKLAAAVWPTTAVDTDKADTRAWGLEVETALNALIATMVPMINGILSVSVNANALTVAIKTKAGADPSAADPVYVNFRQATESDGDIYQIELTAAAALTVTAGATLGAVDGEAARFWVVAFNDGGTLRLGLINCLGYSAPDFTIHPLDESRVASSTVMSGSADSAGVFYTSAAVTGKAFKMLGFLGFEANKLATAGLYANVPDVVKLQSVGDPLPGDLVQMVMDRDAAVATTTTVTPSDDTVPQLSTEGATFLSQAITPKSQANLLEVEAAGRFGLSVGGVITMALHQDSIEDALAAVDGHGSGAADRALLLRLRHWLKGDTAAATTFKVNAGGSAAGTLTFNGVSGGRIMGGIGFSDLTIREIMA